MLIANRSHFRFEKLAAKTPSFAGGPIIGIGPQKLALIKAARAVRVHGHGRHAAPGVPLGSGARWNEA